MASAIDNLAPGVNGGRDSGSLDQVLRRASAETGIDFKYLLQTAERESSLNPTLKAGASSATGLFQFVDQTWLATVKSDGARFGLAKEARQIEQNADGQFFVRDSARRRAILDLRKDPELSAKLAGALTQKNADYLARATGREPTGEELYVAHFLGAKGAVDLVRASREQPEQSAARLFPEAARATRTIFYDASGGERTASEVYGLLTSRHESGSFPRAPGSDPENTLASHAPAGNKPSRYLAGGAEAAFLASHYGAATSAFSPQPEGAETPGAFGTVFGPRETAGEGSFFAPQVHSDDRNFPAPRHDEDDVLPSRYGRVDDPEIFSRPAGPPISADAISAGAIEAEAGGAQKDGIREAQAAAVYSSVSSRGERAGSPRIGPPLDLSRYLKAPSSK